MSCPYTARRAVYSALIHACLSISLSGKRRVEAACISIYLRVSQLCGQLNSRFIKQTSGFCSNIRSPSMAMGRLGRRMSAPARPATLDLSIPPFGPERSEIKSEISVRSERSIRFAARCKQNSRLSLTDHHSADVGTVKELDDAVRGAREALQSFADTVTPKPTMYRAFYFGNCVYTFRFLLQRGAMSKPMRRNASRAAGWPRLARAWGTQMYGLALRAASGA